jgi:hypothetical protein
MAASSPANLRRLTPPLQVAGRRECGYMGADAASLPLRGTASRMADFFRILTPIVILAVFVVLVLGIVNMLRRGGGNRSQALMRWRVILQFAAIVVMMAGLYFASRGN